MILIWTPTLEQPIKEWALQNKQIPEQTVLKLEMIPEI
jgi:hypothetical protein